MLATLFFFIIVVSLFPLGIGPEQQLLRTIAPGVVWVAALLASMLALGRTFGNDYQDGTLEQLMLTPQPLYLIVLAKVLAQWVVSEVPLVLVAPVLGLQFGLSQNTLAVMTVSLLLGTPVLSLDRLDRRSTDIRIALGECSGRAACLAALHSGADFRLGRDRSHGQRKQSAGLSSIIGSDARFGFGVRALGNYSRAANICGIRKN